jgi:hypothetical protein
MIREGDSYPPPPIFLYQLLQARIISAKLLSSFKASQLPNVCRRLRQHYVLSNFQLISLLIAYFLCTVMTDDCQNYVLYFRY